jgi:RNase P/RNase MRP subunit POP5
MKTKLKPSARVKKRYLLLSGAGKEEIEKAILDYIGILGWARAMPIFAEIKKEGNIVLAVERGELNNVRAAFEASQSKIKVMRVSGTLKGLEKI